MSKAKLTVALATYNEAENIVRCLEAVKGIADEIIVVDGSSNDETRKLARKLGAIVIKTENKANFHINKKKAITKAKNDWVLQLDADEIVTKELAREIQSVINMQAEELESRQLNPAKKRLFERHQKAIEDRDGKIGSETDEIVAFFIPRLNIFLGHEMRATGVYPDGVIRLFRKSKAYLPARDVHEQLEVKGKVSWLENDLVHLDSPTFAKYILRANRYTSWTAKQLYGAKTSINLVNDFKYLIYLPTMTFLKLYIRHKGYKDRFPGFVFSLFSGLHHALAYMKLRDLYRS